MGVLPKACTALEMGWGAHDTTAREKATGGWRQRGVWPVHKPRKDGLLAVTRN